MVAISTSPAQVNTAEPRAPWTFPWSSTAGTRRSMIGSTPPLIRIVSTNGRHRGNHAGEIGQGLADHDPPGRHLIRPEVPTMRARPGLDDRHETMQLAGD